MSRYMLCDDATINDVNPFVVHDFSLPGGVRQTPEFADHTKDVGVKRDGIKYEKLSPICDIAATMGDRTVDFCKGGREPPCPLGRAVHPRRNIDYGFTRTAHKTATNAQTETRVGLPAMNILAFIVLLVLVVLILRR
jgi:hypothetical protein